MAISFPAHASKRVGEVPEDHIHVSANVFTTEVDMDPLIASKMSCKKCHSPDEIEQILTRSSSTATAFG